MYSRDCSLLAAMCLFIAIVLSWLVLSTRPAYPQQSTIYDSRTGRVIGRATIDSQGTTWTYGADGRLLTQETASQRRGPRSCPFQPSCLQPR
jgi:hypothetical protein